MDHYGDVRQRAFMAASRVVDKASAEDIAQETMIRVWRLTHTNPFGLAMRTARRLALNYVRNERLHAAKLGSYPFDVVAPALPTPDEGDLVRDMQILVEKLLAALPEDQRTTVWLVLGEGCSRKEAADILSVALGTVDSRMGRAMATMRKLLLFETQHLIELCR